MTKRARVAPDGPEFDDEAAAEAEIGFMFRQKLAGLRRLPKRDRIHALRAAKVWRAQALKALKEKSATARQFQYAQRRRARMPEPT
jgi:hypothetical protein